jgi:F-type H+-transporting ATPase subunit b
MEALGFNLTWFLFQLGNFALLFFGLSYLLHKPIGKLLDDRRRMVKEALENAENVKRELSETQKQRDELLQETRAHNPGPVPGSQARRRATEREVE